MPQKRSRKPSHVNNSIQNVHLRTDSSFGLTLPGGHGVNLTRRQFLWGALGVTGAAVLTAGGVAVSQALPQAEAVETLKVPTDAVLSSEDCERIEDTSSVMRLAVSKELPYGTLVYANDPAVAACVVPADTAKPLTEVALLSLSSGTLTTVLPQAVNLNEGFEIYDARACSQGIVWTESNILDGIWRVYGATSSVGASSIGQPVLLDEGDSEWEMPSLAAVGNYAWWQVLPRVSGSHKTEDSLLKRARFGSNDVEVAYTSHGRMSTPPYAMTDKVVIAPRADTAGTYYQLTCLDADTAEVLDAMVLPSSMSPLEAGYGPNGFNFSFEAIYNYGGGIANLGTYTPISSLAGAHTSFLSPSSSEEQDGDVETSIQAGINRSTAAYSAAPWFRFARTPSAPASWCNNWFMVKSTSSVCGVDLKQQKYFVLNIENGTDDFGDYLASTGDLNRVVTYSHIDYQPVSGDNQRYCLVRIWEPVEAVTV